MQKSAFALLSIFLSLAACAAPQPQSGMDTQISPTPGLQSASLPQTRSVTPFSTASESPPTSIPITPTLPPHLEAGAPVTLVSIHMIDSDVGWGIEEGGHVVRTDDGGLTWTDVTPPELVDRRILGIFLDGQTAWAQKCDHEIGNCQLLRTINGGKTWTVQAENVRPNFYFTSLTFLNQNDGLSKAYDVGAGHGTTVVYQTHDGGSTWEQLMLTNPDGMPGTWPGAIDTCNICGDVFYYSPRRMMIIRGDLASSPGGAVRLLISMDLGKTWEEVRLPLPDGKFVDGYISPMQPAFFNDKDGVLPFQIIKYNPDWSIVYEVTAVYSTHDGGQTWQTNSTVLENVSHITFLSPQDAFAICQNTLCVTQDGAQTWQMLSTNLKFGYSDSEEYVEKFHFVTPALGWALTVYNELHSLWKTSDGGQTWEEIEPVLEDR